MSKNKTYTPLQRIDRAIKYYGNALLSFVFTPQYFTVFSTWKILGGLILFAAMVYFASGLI